MRSVDIAAAFKNGYLEIVEEIDLLVCDETFGYLRVGDLVAFPVFEVATFLNQSSDIEVHDESGKTFATLCFTVRLKEAVASELTKWQYVAYLADVEIAELGNLYTFKQNYLLVDATSAQTYIDRYMDSAAIWGGFSHSTSLWKSHTRSLHNLKVTEALAMPTAHHKEAFGRYIAAQNGFDRFLRLYHTIELLFDFIIMKKIQELGNDLSGFATLMTSLGHAELDRLKHIVREFCSDPAAILMALENVPEHHAICSEMFQKHNKSGNPITDEVRWNKFWTLLSSQQLTVNTAKVAQLAKSESEFHTFVCNTASYWIYRTRSSIAHNRVGEFLLKNKDEPFVVEVAERLLLEVVRQVFSSAKMRALCA